MSLDSFLTQIHHPQPMSHKGQNGKALIVGGSDLFHAASQWSFKAASRLVDMTFYSSVVDNNELVHDAKFYGTDGVVVRRADLPSYLDEVNAVLIGPGMRRDIHSRFSPQELDSITLSNLAESDWENDTQAITSVLLRGWPQKRWVIDAGALQVMQPEWIPPEAILTPHAGELAAFVQKLFGGVPVWAETLAQKHIELGLIARGLAGETESFSARLMNTHDVEAVLGSQLSQLLKQFSADRHNAVVLLKGAVDIIWNAEQVVVVAGGNAGLTKGGTGDVLAGLTLGLRATSPAFASAVVASWMNKEAGHSLYQRQGTMFNSSDLVDELPKIWEQLP